MSVAHQFADYVQSTVHDYMHQALAPLGFSFDRQAIWHDFARSDTQGLQCTFYINTVDNVNRKDFNKQVEQLKQTHPELLVLKVKSKRPGQCVRFFMHVHNAAQSQEMA